MADRITQFALLASLAGCAQPALYPASQYRVAPAVPPVVLAFAPGRNMPAPAEAAYLRGLGVLLPAWIVPRFVAVGPRALARARATRELVGRPLVLSSPGPMDRSAGPDVAVLFLPSTSGVLADSCRGLGQPVVGTMWPSDDSGQPRLLPAGCAVAVALQAQVAAADGSRDLLVGRSLLPGATTPFTDAVEAYYRRNDPSQHASPATSSKSGNPNTPDNAPPTPGMTVQTGAPAAVPANPLLGPLPGAPAQ